MGHVVIFIYSTNCILPVGIKYLAAIVQHATAKALKRLLLYKH